MAGYSPQVCTKSSTTKELTRKEVVYLCQSPGCFDKCIFASFERCPKAIRSERAASRTHSHSDPRQGYCLSGASFITSAVLPVFAPGIYDGKFSLVATSKNSQEASLNLCFGALFQGAARKEERLLVFNPSNQRLVFICHRVMVLKEK